MSENTSFTKPTEVSELKPQHYCTYAEAIFRLSKAHPGPTNTAEVLAIIFDREVAAVESDLEKS